MLVVFHTLWQEKCGKLLKLPNMHVQTKTYNYQTWSQLSLSISGDNDYYEYTDFSGCFYRHTCMMEHSPKG